MVTSWYYCSDFSDQKVFILRLQIQRNHHCRWQTYDLPDGLVLVGLNLPGVLLPMPGNGVKGGPERDKRVTTMQKKKERKKTETRSQKKGKPQGSAFTSVGKILNRLLAP